MLFRSIRAGVGATHKTIEASILRQMTVENEPQIYGDSTEIKIVPLDDFIDENPTLIKLDVEGAEVDALIGAARMLRQCRPKIFIEVHTQFIGKFGYNLTDLFLAIPSDIYDIKLKVARIDRQWRTYRPGEEVGVTVPLLIYATPKLAISGAD